MPKIRYEHGDDTELERWYKNICRGSKITGDVYYRRMRAFCDDEKVTPAQIASMKEKDLRNLLMDFVTENEKKGFAGSYTKSTVKVIRSWLEYNNVKFESKIKIKNVDSTPSLRGERSPRQDELKRIFLSGDKKARVACVLMAHSGIRPEVIGNYEGNDGLRISDLPDLQMGDEITFATVPAKIIVRETLSKTGKEYFSFIGLEGCAYIADYLKERRSQGEVLTQDSFLLTPKRKTDRASRASISTTNIGDTIRGAIRKAGFQWRPYVLRIYFDTQLMIAESQSLIIRDYRTFLMGHSGDIENRYTTNKHKLPDELIDDIRESYRRSLKYLETEQKGIPEEELDRLLTQKSLKWFGFSEDEIRDMINLSDDEITQKINDKLSRKMLNNGNRQKSIPVKEVEQYLDSGWELVSFFPSGDKAIVRVPS